LIDNSSDEHLRRAVKKELRKRMRSVRNTLPASAIEARSHRVVENVLALPAWRAAKAVALFWPIEGRHEIDVRPLFEAARSAGVSTFFPWTDADSAPPRLVLREVNDASTFAERGHGYEEPRDDARVAAPGEIDLVIVPALAVDGRGHRLGYGAGYYDRLLPEICPPAIAVVVALSFQLLVEVPTIASDVACHLIVTDEGVIEAGVGVQIETGAIELPPSEIDLNQPGVRVIQRPVRSPVGDASVPAGTRGGAT
jgi:5-formyltetrahydrofolate cyclo-ligase